MFSVVSDKMCVFCLYSIPNSQQYVKRGSCRRLILSGLLCLFSFWASGPFVTSFEFGPRTLSVFFIYRVFELFYFSYLFCILLFVPICYLSFYVLSYLLLLCFVFNVVRIFRYHVFNCSYL